MVFFYVFGIKFRTSNNSFFVTYYICILLRCGHSWWEVEHGGDKDAPFPHHVSGNYHILKILKIWPIPSNYIFKVDHI